MIIQETENGLVKTYSNLGVYIHGGFPEGDYAEAIDPVESGRTYIETDIPIESEGVEEPSEAEEILDIILGENK